MPDVIDLLGVSLISGNPVFGWMQVASDAAVEMPLVQKVLMSLLFVGCIACWGWAFFRQKRLPLICRENQSPVPWNLLDVLVVIAFQFVFVVGLQVIYALAKGLNVAELGEATASSKIEIAMCGSIGMFIATVVGLAYLKFAGPASASDLGICLKRIRFDCFLGVIAFLAVIAPVLFLQVALEQMFPQAQKHPFIQLVQEQNGFFYFTMIFVMAVVFAPIVEEFLFRVVIQGWVERLMTATAIHRDSMTEPYSRIDRMVVMMDRSRLSDRILSGGRAWLPIIISAGLFAAAHIGHGTAPIPLFFLAIALGYVYQRTHRLWPSLVTHMLVNLLAMVQLKIAIDYGIQV